MQHFENLWEEAEKLLKQDTDISSCHELLKEAIGKLSALDALNTLSQKEESMSPEDAIKLKTNIMGKLILVLTQISAKDNINVYAALKAALDDKKITIFEAKYK